MTSLRRLQKFLGPISIAFMVSACVPPLPPELQAVLADDAINCGQAPVSVSGSSQITPILEQWSLDYLSLCPSAGVSQLNPEEGISDVAFSDSPNAPEGCFSYLTVPMMVGGVSISTTLLGLDGIILDAKVISDIVNGAITSWADPQIIALNPTVEVIDLPVVLSTQISRSEADSLEAWFTRIAPEVWNGFPETFTIGANFDAENPPPEIDQDGGFAIVPYSYAMVNSLQTAAILVDPTLEAVPVSLETVASGSTQIVVDSAESPLIAFLDPEISPLPAAGFDEASSPWQGLEVRYAHACDGSSEQDVKSFLRFGLRTDSQNALASYGDMSLPIEVRGKALALVSRGLPSPSPIAQ